PAMTVKEKIFATLWPDEKRAVLKLRLEDQADLVAARSAAFSLNAWSKQGWTNLHLEKVSVAECRELVEQAWRVVAPKKLVRAYDEEKSAGHITSLDENFRCGGETEY
ncbi:MAG: MmcQ/YjbR family DNA-binding protein, partial [Verrucomicrobiota bacterium]